MSINCVTVFLLMKRITVGFYLGPGGLTFHNARIGLTPRFVAKDILKL